MPLQTVDWTSPICDTRRRYAVTCGSCGYTRWLKAADARKAERTGGCFRCSQREKAKRGFAAMARQYGHRWAMRHVQAYREAHPSTPEQEMAALLDQLGVYYRREVPLATKAHGRRRWTCLLDFVVYHDGREWAVEVDGVYWHSTPERIKSDQRKNRLLKRRHIPLLRVTDADLHANRAEQLIIDYLRLELSPTRTAQLEAV